MRIIILWVALFSITFCSFAQDRKWYHHVEGGILTYGPAPNKLGYSFRTIHGHQIYNDFNFGMGLGLEKYEVDKEDDHKAIPVFAQVIYNLPSTRKSRFFTAFDLGYAFNLNRNFEDNFQKGSYKGGILVSPQVGVKIPIGNFIESMYFSAGYKYQQFSKERKYTSMIWGPQRGVNIQDDDVFQNYQTFEYNLSRLSVMLGFSF